jgi:hypothetical protein
VLGVVEGGTIKGIWRVKETVLATTLVRVIARVHAARR